MISFRSKRIVSVAIPALAAGIFALDCLTPRGVVDWVLYFIPLFLSVHADGRFSPYRLAAIFSALAGVGFYFSPSGSEPGIELTNLCLGIATLWAVAVMVAKLRWAMNETRKLEQAVKQSPASIMITDVAGMIAYVNPKFTEVTGYSPPEVIGKNPRILKAGKTPPEEYKGLWDTLRAGKEWHGTFRNRKKNGDLYRALTSIAPIVDEAGKSTHFLAVSEDITEQDRVQEELRWKTAFLEAQMNSALDGILVVDSQHKKILQNQRFAEMFQLPKEIAEEDDDTKMLQHVMGQVKNPQQFSERVAQLYAQPDEIGRDEIELLKGTILDRYSSPVRDQAGKYYGRIWTFRDITQAMKLQARLVQAQKMESIGQLAGGVAHDFNNIMAVIQMQADLLKSGSGLSADQAEISDEIIITVQRAAALTRQLLLFSRREVFQPRDLDLSESITSTVKMLNRIVGETIRVELKLARQPLFIHADAGMMDQVLLNLTVNARDAMPNGGLLIIETSAIELDEYIAAQSAQARPGSFVCLSVSDSGCGIPPEIMPKIFEPFFTTKGVGKGTGLGLATLFGIVQQHQGWVNVYSEVNHGTTFRIYLPRLARNSGLKSAQPVLTDMSGGSETILLVEDDHILRLSVRKALARLGYRILEAPSGPQALEVWKQNREDIRLLLTDLVMPDGMTGQALAQRLLKENPKLKVVYVSGYSAEVVGKEFPLKEGDNFLTKPFQATKLAQIIRQNLDASM